MKHLMTENNRRWWILFAMSAALSLVFVDQTAVPVALPAIQKSLHISNIEQQWVVNAYLLSLAMFIILGGKIVDVLSARSTFLVGLVIFIISSILCATAQTGWEIIAARAMEGLGGAFMTPAMNVIIFGAFPENERGRAIGLSIGVSSVFLSLGPFLGGLITEYLTWRWVFWINFPISLVSAVLTLLAVPKAAANTSKLQLDIPGFLTLITGICPLIIGLMEIPSLGISSPILWGLFALSAVSLCLFVVIERRVSEPLVDFSLFKYPIFNRSISIITCQQAAGITMVFWVLFFQEILGFSPLQGGLALVPGTLPVLFMAPIAGRLRDLYGPRRPMLIGSIVLLVSSFWFLFFLSWHSYWWLLPAFVLWGIGVPCVMSNAMTTALSSVPVVQRGVASGISTAARQLGASLGLAVMGLIIATLDKYKLQSLLPSSVEDSIQSVNVELLLSGVEPASVQGLSQDKLMQLYEWAKQSYTFGFNIALLFVVGLIVCVFLLARKMPQEI